MIRPESDSAQVRFPPPLLLLCCLIAGWGLDQAKSWPILPAAHGREMRFALAGALILSGVALVTYCAWLFKRAQTNIEPWRATSSIITSGPYRYSRNPIYVGFVAAGVGVALAFDTVWILVGVLAFIVIANKFVIGKEEPYLEKKFGEPYRNYRRETRRWL